MDFQKENIYHILEKVVTRGKVSVDEPMKEHTSFRAGGNAAVYAEPADLEELTALVQTLEKEGLPYMVMGNGSNLLFRDGEYEGVVVCLKQLNQVSVEGSVITAQCGVLLSQLANEACRSSLSGMEFAGGIPGSLGGALFMNAGAYGGEMKDIVLSTTSLMADGTLKKRTADELEFGYRTSGFQKTGEIVISAEISLKPGDEKTIRETMKDFNSRRNEKQPVNLPSAGSFFKRPEGHFAGKLVEDAGLKGFSVGGASVSGLHAGFIVNHDNATATDILDLMVIVQNTVKDKFGVELHPEVQIK